LTSGPAQAADPLKLVFLGDQGHHRPADFAGRIIPIFQSRGISIQYTEDINVLAADRLKEFDGLIIYANIAEISSEQEKALLDFVASGKGFIPIHCATFCFRNSEAYVALCGAQFKSHGAEEFETISVAPEHPIMKGFGGFRSWDETYVHAKHNERDRVVLEVRRQGKQAEGNREEPWTWVRTHGRGRVFYTAWGHDARTWAQPGFQHLLERGIRWAVGSDPALAGEFPGEAASTVAAFPVPKIKGFRQDVRPFTYTEVGAKIPNYTPGAKRGSQGSPLTKMQDPLPAEEAIKHYVTPDGFEMALWTSDPDLQGKPIAMNWDERGRLWICETYDYPNELQPIGQGRDRIRICEDTDRDGRADRFTVFAEKLSIPTAVEFCRGGAIVQDGTTTVYLKDLDGDDRADFRQTLITGWALGDTHGGVSNFHYAADNWIWAMQGYNDSHPVINGQEQPGFRMGFWRFRVEPGQADATAPLELVEGTRVASEACQSHAVRVREIEFIRATSNNTWGLGMSEEGLFFGSTANGNPSNFMPIPNRYYERVKGWAPSTLKMISDTYKFAAATDKVRQVDWHGGYTAAAGHALYTGRNYPKAWWNRLAFVCEPTGHLVGAFVLSPQGADYRSVSPFNLAAADDEWAAPIMAEVGPDGNMWIVDWYNYIVQHNPTPQGFTTGKGKAYESELRDKKHGRVYRVLYQGQQEAPTAAAKLAEAVVARGLGQASAVEWVDVLSHPTMRWRLLAQRKLVEGKADDQATLDRLLKVIAESNVDAIGMSVGAMHGLWTLRGLGVVDPQRPVVWSTVAKALSSPLPGVRRAAIQALPLRPESVELLKQSGVVKDEQPQVRLAAWLQLSDIPAAASDGLENTLSQLDETAYLDPWLLDAWTAAAASRVDVALPALLTRAKPWPPEVAGRLEILGAHLARSRPSVERVHALLAALQDANAENAMVVMQGLERGWPADLKLQLEPAAGQMLGRILEKLPVNGKGLLLRLAGNWGSEALEGQLEKISRELLAVVSNAKADSMQRVEAAKMMVLMQPQEESVVERVMATINPQLPADTVVGFLTALQGSKAKNVASSMLKQLATLTPEAKSAAFRVLLARPETTLALLEAVRGRQLAFSELQLDQQQALRDHPDASVRELTGAVIRAGGGDIDANRVKLVEEWSGICEEKGEAARGKAIFTKHCSLCHQHSGEGNAVGPDLTGMAVHPKHELLTHILAPNQSVEGNFRVYSLQTFDGLVLTGMLAGESRTSVELIDAQGKRQTIQREDIENFQSSRKSLMPEGFESQIDREAMKDLLEFLTTKGQYLPLPLAQVATAISTKGLFHDGDDGPDRLVFSDWKPKTIENVPFVLVDPQDQRVPNIVLLHGPRGTMPPKMPKSVTVPCNTAAKAIHFLSGISGWGYPALPEESVSMVVRLRYEDGETEDIPLRNGVHFADYIRQVDVPGSKFAAALRNQQVRYLKVEPKRSVVIKNIELVKGSDASAPIVMAMTVETK
jgi:putative membrane-bound dehydrogenase-like protein